MPDRPDRHTPPATADADAPTGHKGGLARWLGPGLLTGASDDDPSGIGTYAQAGAQFGFGLLWVMLFTFPLMSAVQLISAHVGRVTGRGLAANLARAMPKWLLLPLLLALLVTNIINIAADLAAMAAAAALLLPGPVLLYSVVFGGASMLLQIFVPYSRYVNLLKWLTLSLFAYVATAFALDVPWLDVLGHTVIPHWRHDHAFVEMLVAVLGTTISPYLFFWQASQEVEEQEAAPDEQPLRVAPEQAPRQLSRMTADTLLGMGVSNTIGFFIMLTTALTLATHGITHIDTAAQAAQALRPIVGPLAFTLFALGIVGTGLLAVPVLAGSGAYALAECYGWRRGLERKPASAPRFYAVIAVAAIAGIALTAFHVDPMRALVLSAVLNGVCAVPVLVAMIWVARQSRLLGEFTIGPWLSAAGGLVTVVMAWAAVMLFL
jgi:NRAMP (natural resistance-associated macrophage protein)-like metal ion transporter